MSIAENVALIRERINAAAEAAGRSGGDIVLVAATKTNSTERIREAIAAGIAVCGENRVQELLEKKPLGAYDGAELHFIGHLQKNKVSKIVGEAALIQSVDSMELLCAIDRAAGQKGLVQELLLEVNIAGEASKSGFSPEDIAEALREASKLSGIKVRGLMAVPPICASGEDNLPYFERMKQLFVDNSKKKYDNVVMDFLSMGMSGDYLTAIACGANMIRLGSAIFGPRVYPQKGN